MIAMLAIGGLLVCPTAFLAATQAVSPSGCMATGVQLRGTGPQGRSITVAGQAVVIEADGSWQGPVQALPANGTLDLRIEAPAPAGGVQVRMQPGMVPVLPLGDG